MAVFSEPVVPHETKERPNLGMNGRTETDNPPYPRASRQAPSLLLREYPRVARPLLLKADAQENAPLLPPAYTMDSGYLCFLDPVVCWQEDRVARYEPGQVVYYAGGGRLRFAQAATRVSLLFVPAVQATGPLAAEAGNAVTAPLPPDVCFLVLQAYKAYRDRQGPATTITGAARRRCKPVVSFSQGAVTRPAWLYSVCEKLDRQWNQFLPLAQLAREAGVNPVTLSKSFPKYLGCTLSEYMRKIKVGKALVFLRRSEESLTGIAYHCGFADQSHFTRTFKDMTGLLPKEYRKL